MFDKKYTDYWSAAVKKSIDGTIIAGEKEAHFFLEEMKISEESKILDVGCSTGRMYRPLADYSEHIYGVEPDPFAVSNAKNAGYLEVFQGTAETTGFQKENFDFVFCWAAFELVDHFKGLQEFNRILKCGGKLLFTGKSNDYEDDDVLAFKAEKNAWLKKFPQRFTDLPVLLSQLKNLGFILKDLYIFPKRGDFGLLNYHKHDSSKKENISGYEYVFICTKESGPQSDLEHIMGLEHAHTKTAQRAAEKNFCNNVDAYFTHLGLD